ncbi:type I restriction-modification enzyme, subunit R [Methanococcus maripaludis X1]|uniref:Type I restriction-modification enzyme, subunit R n=1 Tax=Methanococcus maripaludis X1 TaxID=1053692 RepID=G0H447_METMI|nr:type I restriction endonuclease [Methanococcus maripaludis]AEK19513.1 type I restriction-modification enzyme, subunit R [Methanococcus maripaludis X1]
MNSNTSEKDFQEHILNHLGNTGYVLRNKKDYHKSCFLDIELVLKFIKNTQNNEWEKYKRIYGEDAEKKFLLRLKSEIQTKKTINVLRNGFKDVGCNFKLFYQKPNNNKNPDHFKLFEKNIFSVIDELEYQNKENGNRLDLVIFINGIPIITIELKDTFSQGVENAIKQYKTDRDPREQLFKNCIVHFAMSDEKIYMTTKLNGTSTEFLPFNRDLENPVIEGEYKTSYLYNDILQKNKLSKLLSNFIYVEKKKDEKTRKIEEKIIFPRFHQLECVNMLLESANPGTNYLIEHSAGSGKTKTISWLSYGLMNKFDKNDNRIYDMVIVVSDRKVIDSQLRKQVKELERVKGVVETIENNSSELKEAIENGSNIIVTTIQKFKYILDEIGDLEKRNYAIIIDEAHSSQSGKNSKALKKILSTNSLEEAEKIDSEELEEMDEKILKDVEDSKNLRNASFFAFTATPKNKTLELFGTPFGETGKRPFHVYSMKQAIEEGFILDVLKNYISYDTYYQLAKKIEEDPEYDKKKAKALLRNLVEKQPETILKKADIMLNHFMSSSINQINHKAKAMIVTRSRLHALLYYQAIEKLIKENNYGIKTLVAFTGTVKHDDVEYTENSLNKLSPNTTIQKAFESNEYKILIVANKFQTGFDQPLLHTMYVDKRLNGIAAVQTLSRTNRIYPGKKSTLIIDFANDPSIIKESFLPYFETTYLEEGTDWHTLYELEEKLLDYGIFECREVQNFVKNYKSGVSQEKLHNILSPIIHEFRGKSKEDQISFKKVLKRYQNIYSFLSQLIPFSDIDLEKLYIFNSFLIKKLPTINSPLPYSIVNDVQLEYYKIKDRGNYDLSLVEGEGRIKPISGNCDTVITDEKEKLSKIVKDLNDTFSTNFTDDDKIFMGQILGKLLKNEELTEQIKNNPKSNSEIVFPSHMKKVMADLLDSNITFYKKVNDNPEIKEKFIKSLFELVYREYHKDEIEV